MRQCLKSIPTRDAEYLKFVRSHRCLLCYWEGSSIEAHHIYTGGMATKCSDYDTVPLCGFSARGCHSRVDQKKNVPQRFLDEVKRLNDEWLRSGHKFKEGERHGFGSETNSS